LLKKEGKIKNKTKQKKNTTAQIGTNVRARGFNVGLLALSLRKILIRSVMINACPAWEFAAFTHLMKFRRP
jgi:hypothetical protein